MKLRKLLMTTALACIACGPSPQTNELKQALADELARPAPRASVAFRIAGDRGADVRLYQLPSLEEVAWRFRTPGLRARRMVGFQSDNDEVYLVTPDSQLTVLDLNSGRARTADSNVVFAALGPIGAPLVSRADGSLARLVGRRMTSVADSLSGTVEALWRGTGGRTFAAVVTDGDRTLVTVDQSQDVDVDPLPDGPMAVSTWGDIAAVGVDSGILLVDLKRDPVETFVPLDTTPVAVTFSAAAHRLYVATAAAEVLTLDRFGLEILDRRETSLGLAGLRMDPAGRVLLARPAAGDTVFVMSVMNSSPARAVAGSWDDDLPMVAPDGTVLLRQEGTVVALGLETLEPLGTAPDAAGDRWLIAPWDPRRPALQLANEQRAAAVAATDQRYYVQVSSTSNEAWATALARDLLLAGMKSTVLNPSEDDETYRVVIGPYPTRDEAEEIGRRLGMPYWIFTETPEPGAP